MRGAALTPQFESRCDTCTRPPPLGDPTGEQRWGGTARNGPALCPLVNLVLPPADMAEAARAAGTFNAQLGRPSTGRVDSAIRCVATRDLAAGTVISSDVPGGSSAPLAAAAGDAVRIVDGSLQGQTGVVLKLRAEDRRPIVRLDSDSKLVVLPSERLEVIQNKPQTKRSKVL